tara:strand:+ start:1504 stop:3405 length:1902 start_codon:yes stop_codon:yes gene_type:complete
MSNVQLWKEGREEPFKLAGRRIDPQSGRIDFEDKSVDIEPRVMAVLIELARQAGTTVKREHLIETVWCGAPGADQSLNNAVSLLRRSLRDTDSERRIVRTIPKRGYQLCAQPEFEGGGISIAEVLPGIIGKSRLSIIAAFSAVLLGTTLFAVTFWPGSQPPSPALTPDANLQTIAVLPFASFSDDPDDVYFADGLAEEILRSLAQVGALKVASRTDSFSFRDSNASISEIGHTLRVANILEGSIRRDGDIVRVTAQLVSANDGAHLWSSTYDENIDGILEIQQDIATNIAGALVKEISGSEHVLLRTMPTDDVASFENYLIGQHELRKWTPKSNQRAIKYLEKAVEQDPQYAEARLALGRAYYFAGTHYGAMTPGETIPKVKASIAYGVSASNPLTRAAALGVYGDVLAWADRDWHGALVAFQRAYELSGSPTLGYGLTNSIIGRHDEAIAVFDTLLRQGSHAIGISDEIGIRNNLAWAYFNARRYQESLEQASLVVAADASFADGYRVLGRAQLQLGDVDAAVGSFSTAARLMGGAPVAISDVGVALARAGREKEAREIIAELEAAEGYVSAPLMAQIYANLGDADAAFRLLEQGLEDSDRGVVFLKINPLYDPIRNDPRFDGLLERLNLSS